jgi:hypothetical protein
METKMLGLINIPPVPEVKAVDDLAALAKILADPVKLAAQLEGIKQAQAVAQNTVDRARAAFTEAKVAEEKLQAEREKFKKHCDAEEAKINTWSRQLDGREQDLTRREAGPSSRRGARRKRRRPPPRRHARRIAGSSRCSARPRRRRPWVKKKRSPS